jgi:mRNA interferase MazF
MPETPDALPGDLAPTFPSRGEIYFVNLDLTVGSEQGGRRPAVIIQNDVGNQYSPVVIAAAITSRPSTRQRLTDVTLNAGTAGLELESRVLLNQIRTLDKRRIGKLVGRLSTDDMVRVDEAIKISLGLISS